MTEYSESSFDDRLKITDLRVRVITHATTLSLAAFAIPIALPTLFDVHQAEAVILWTAIHYWAFAIVGWATLGVSIAAGVVFVSQVPKWAKDQSYDKPTDLSYFACVFAFLLGILLLGAAGLIAVMTGPPL